MASDSDPREAIKLVKSVDQWLDRAGPELSVVASSRVRLARNLPEIIFPPRARAEDLRRAADALDAAIRSCPEFAGFRRVALSALEGSGRSFLKESHFISSEMERGGEHRYVYIDEDASAGLMVNEEDHLRMFCLLPGLQLQEAWRRARAMDEALQRRIDFAFSETAGYLTACATNTGTGLRASAMIHLPGLAMTKTLEKAFSSVPEHGLTVRGSYGENSEFLGDFYQVSNERTLGKPEEEVVETVAETAREALEGEAEARGFLFREKQNAIDDAIWRSHAILSSARVIDTVEASKLLSKMRLGIERGYFAGLTHEKLNKLVVEIQPGHLQLLEGNGEAGPMESEKRDALRARLLRERIAGITERN